VVIQGILSTGLPIHLSPLLVERGFSLDAAVAAFAVIGTGPGGCAVHPSG
jgi:hypothetical protein